MWGLVWRRVAAIAPMTRDRYGWRLLSGDFWLIKPNDKDEPVGCGSTGDKENTVRNVCLMQGQWTFIVSMTIINHCLDCWMDSLQFCWEFTSTHCNATDNMDGSQVPIYCFATKQESLKSGVVNGRKNYFIETFYFPFPLKSECLLILFFKFNMKFPHPEANIRWQYPI